jgi:hypothetical protein
MRNVLFISFFIFSLLLTNLSPTYVSAGTTKHKATYYVNANNVSIYKDASTKSKVIIKVNKNTKVESSTKTTISKTTWYKVKSGSKVGWLKSTQVSKEKVKLNDYDKLKKVTDKYKATLKSTTTPEKHKEYLFKKGYEEGWITHYTSTKVQGKNVLYVKSKRTTAPPALFDLGIDASIAVGFPISRKDLASMAKKAQANPHKLYYTKDKKITVTADRGKQIYLTYYEDKNASKLLGF